MAVTTYQNFDLLITRSGDDYRAFVVDAPGGDADATFALPFTGEELDFLGDLAGVRRGRGAGGSSGTVPDLKELGSLLYGAVFQSKVAAVLATSLEKVEQEQVGLRLRLRFSDETSELATLPWEILYDPVQERFLALSESSPILRYLSLPRARPTLLVEPPLHVLSVLVSPSGYEELNVEREWQVLETALAGLVGDGKFVLDRLEEPTFAALQERLLRDDIHILHFVGHGVYDDTAGAGALVLADRAGNAQEVSGEELATLLHNHRSLRLVYLNACEGALSSNLSVFSGVAQTLVQQGVPAVVAMQAEISDDAAIELSRLFYSALAAGYPVDAALTQARVAIAARSAEWAIPVLFSRSPDNRLFDVVEVLPAPDCPYPGMVPFTEQQAGVFFGRDKEIADGVERLRQHPFLTVIGPSGSGKSSLVYAGVIPALRKSKRFGAGEWDVKILRPGEKPLTALAAALNLSPDQLFALPLNRGEMEGGGRTLLFVDQFEELFTLADATQAQRFLDTLNALIGKPNLYLLLTVRADFYPDLMASSLWQPIRANRLELIPLGNEELRAAILQPAAQVGVTIDEVLVERLVADAAGESGALPLVQETLVLLWEKVERRYLPLKAYTEMAEGGRNGLQVAIDRRANTVYENLLEEARPIARRIFLRLVQFGEGRADTRRQQTVAELRASGDDPAIFDRALARLTESRLLTASAAEGSARRVDIAHEALIGVWSLLQRWIVEQRETEQIRRRLEEKVTEWNRLGRGKGGLLDSVELAEAESWLTGEDAVILGHSLDFDEFIRASREHYQEQLFAQAKARSESVKQQRALINAQRQRVWITSGAVIIIATITGIFFWLNFEPSTMPKSTFNIAVADFSFSGSTSDSTSLQEGQELANRFAVYLEKNAGDIEPLLGDVTVWGPKETGLITPDTVAGRTQEIGAHLVLYGHIELVGQERWEVTPLFYIADRTVDQVSEGGGSFILGQTFQLMAGNVVSVITAFQELEPRLHQMIRLMLGIGYLSFGDAGGYRKAEEVLFQAIQNGPIGDSSNADSPGTETLYMFLGNAFLGESQYTTTESERQVLLVQAKQAYETGLAMNPNFPRLYNSLGGVLFQMARPSTQHAEDECNWSSELLNEALYNHRQALATYEQAFAGRETAEFRGHLGIGRIFFWKGFCDINEGQLDIAKEHLQKAVELYIAQPLPYLASEASIAYQNIGFLALLQAVRTIHGLASGPPNLKDSLADSVRNYEESVSLALSTGTSDGSIQASEILPYYIVGLCLNDQADTANTIIKRLPEEIPSISIVEKTREVVGAFGLTGMAQWEDCIHGY